MKVSLKTLVFVVALSSLLVVGAYFGWSKAKASTVKAEAAKTAAPVEYLFTNNGITFGADPSPLQIVQVAYGGKPLTIGSAVAGDANLLDGMEVRLRNSSPQDIKRAQLRVDVLDPATNRIVATMAGLSLNTLLAPGQEQSGKVISYTSELLRQSLSNSGLAFQRVMIQVDFVEMTNETSWKYGLLHRLDPDSQMWRPITIGKQKISLDKRSQADKNGATVVKASFSSKTSLSHCKVFGGYHLNPRTDCPYCTVYNENWYLDPENGFAYAGEIPYYCSGGGVCSKIGYQEYCSN